MFKLIVTPHRGTSTEHDFATFAELRRYAVDVEGVPMTAFTSRIGGRPRTSHTFHGCVWNWAEVAGTPAPLDIPAATPEATTAGARILRRFVTDARVAELNGGTLIFGGRNEAPAVRKLVRDGLLERVRETSGCRLADAGRAWLTANSAAYRNR